MTVGATSGIDAFLAAREAAARRLESPSAIRRVSTQNLTRSVSTVDHVAASQAPKAPSKGSIIDVLA